MGTAKVVMPDGYTLQTENTSGAEVTLDYWYEADGGKVLDGYDVGLYLTAFIPTNETLEAPFDAEVTIAIPDKYNQTDMKIYNEGTEVPITFNSDGTITFVASIGTKFGGAFSSYFNMFNGNIFLKTGGAAPALPVSDPWTEEINNVVASIKSTGDGDVVKISRDSGIDTLTSGALLALADKENVSLQFEYTYMGVDYEIIIPAGKVIIVEGVDYYGPLFLYSLYGQMQEDDSDYTIMPGDTLGNIAAKNGTTVNALMELNPQIKNANLIRVGQTLRLR